jgi:hypothetical protein
VRDLFAELILRAQLLSGAADERIDEFFRYGMSLNVAAALGVDSLSTESDWVIGHAGASPAPSVGPAHLEDPVGS